MYLYIVYTLLLVAFVFYAIVFSISFSHADVVCGLLVTSSPHFFIAIRAKGWESSKDIGNPDYPRARFAARLILAC